MVKRMLIVMMAGLLLLCGVSIAEMTDDHAAKGDTVTVQTQQPADEAHADDGAKAEEHSENSNG